MDFQAAAETYAQDANVKFKGTFEFVDSLDQEQLEAFKEFIYQGVTFATMLPDTVKTWLNYWNGITAYRLLKDFDVKPWDEKIDFNEEEARKLAEGQ